MKACTIGCKLPNGLILESGVKIVNGNVVRTPEYVRIRLAGANQSRIATVDNESPNTKAPFHFIPGITEGVDEDVYDAWVEAHKDSNIVKNGLIFKAPNKREASAMANYAKQKPMGLEPLNPKAIQRTGMTARNEE